MHIYVYIHECLVWCRCRSRWWRRGHAFFAAIIAWAAGAVCPAFAVKPYCFWQVFNIPVNLPVNLVCHFCPVLLEALVSLSSQFFAQFWRHWGLVHWSLFGCGVAWCQWWHGFAWHCCWWCLWCGGIPLPIWWALWWGCMWWCTWPLPIVSVMHVGNRYPCVVIGTVMHRQVGRWARWARYALSLGGTVATVIGPLWPLIMAWHDWVRPSPKLHGWGCGMTVRVLWRH